MMTKPLVSLRKSRLGHRCAERMVICATLLLIGTASFAADGGDGPPRDTTAVQTNETVEGLLQKIEQQIAAGHTMVPPADCAVDTWAHVVQAMAAKRSPQVTDALANFATDARNRAAREMRAGNTVVAGDLLVFANQATGLLARSADAARTGTPQGSPDNAALTFEPLAAALPPMPHADATPVSPPADTPDRTPAVQPGIAPPQTEVQALVVGFYIARGNQLRAAGNVAAARTYYEYAGNARAAATPARADDPGPGARPEVRVEARHSYRDHLRWQRSHALYGGTKAPVPPAVAPAEIAVP